MALFQKKIHDTSVQPLYRLGTNKSVLIVGLGNPGSEYTSTRHNVGFETLDFFAEKNGFPKWIVKKDLICVLSTHMIGDSRVILCKPDTFMNNSGEAVGSVQRFYKVFNHHTVVVHDELAIEFGQIRTRLGGGDAGHNGVKSLVKHVGSDFSRIRIGIHNSFADRQDAEGFVLSKFNSMEVKNLSKINREVNTLLLSYLIDGKLEHQTRKID